MDARTVGYWAASVFAGLLTLACGEEKCSRGEPCDETCAAGQTALCVVDGICRCTEQDDGGIGGGQGNGGSSGGGASVPPPEGCDAPEPGNLIINEVLVDSVADSGLDEFVEIVNVTEAKIAVGGLKLTTTKPGDVPVEEDRWTIQAGCLAARSSVVVFKDKLRLPETSSPAVAAVAATPIGGGLRNSGDLDMHLFAGAVEIDRLLAEDSAWAKGVSVNRRPDLTPASAARHTAISGAGTTYSPGACANGGTFQQLCRDGATAADGGVGGAGGAGGAGGSGGAGGMNTGGVGGGGMNTGGMVVPPPVCETLAPPVALVINEVYADPTESPEGDFEFIELVNAGPSAIVLDGFSIWAPNGDNVLVARYIFMTGTLPAGGAVAIYGNLPPEQWVWDPIPPVMPIKADETFSLVNDANPLAVVIRDQAGGEITRFEVPRALNVAGKSVNRCHDIDGTSPVLHDTLGGGTSSPGKCSNGGAFSANCAPPGPPPPGSMP